MLVRKIQYLVKSEILISQKERRRWGVRRWGHWDTEHTEKVKRGEFPTRSTDGPEGGCYTQMDKRCWGFEECGWSVQTPFGRAERLSTYWVVTGEHFKVPHENSGQEFNANPCRLVFFCFSLWVQKPKRRRVELTSRISWLISKKLYKRKWQLWISVKPRKHWGHIVQDGAHCPLNLSVPYPDTGGVRNSSWQGRRMWSWITKEADPPTATPNFRVLNWRERRPGIS